MKKHVIINRTVNKTSEVQNVCSLLEEELKAIVNQTTFCQHKFSVTSAIH